MDDLLRRWQRNRDLFDQTNGLAVARDVEMELRKATDEARSAFEAKQEELNRDWRPGLRGWVRSLGVARAEQRFVAAVQAENVEYHQTLLYRGLDPDDEEELARFLESYHSDPIEQMLRDFEEGSGP